MGRRRNRKNRKMGMLGAGLPAAWRNALTPEPAQTAIDAKTFGLTVHGEHFFRCSLISQVDETLWIGGVRDGLILNKQFKHVVSLYQWESYLTDDAVESTLTIQMMDGDRVPDPELLYRLAHWVNWRREQGPTLVHCQAGLNRSGLVVALSLIVRGMEPRAAIELLRRKRTAAVLCNTQFEAWLLRQQAGQQAPSPSDRRRSNLKLAARG